MMDLSWTLEHGTIIYWRISRDIVQIVSLTSTSRSAIEQICGNPKPMPKNPRAALLQNPSNTSHTTTISSSLK